ncbi:MAG: hypothetical protein HQ546_07895 [Planctomycetes bacterium]|nr:hypothetical protein [Planctomycetota bacterium]
MKKTEFLFALVQHPMILLINEDRGEPPVGERVPPWGATDLASYAQRVRRNLQAMNRYKDLCLNYEFSAVELEMLAQAAPDVIPTMREMVAQGRLAFLGGDYSQAHGQLYSGELNFRQLEEGLKVFRELVGYEVTNNFHQETCAHDQMPQLLLAFGFKTALPPVFAHTLTPIAGSPCMVGNDFQCMITHYAPIAADAVATWQGLDGSEIPLVVLGVSSAILNEKAVEKELHKGCYAASNIVVTAPDMEEIDEERYKFIQAHGRTVRLDQAALELVARQKPTWTAKLTSYWSYAEGEWAEAVTRKIRQAEVALLAEDALSASRGLPARNDSGKDWQTVLAAKHHDVHWLEVTDLKQTYINRMDQIVERAGGGIARAVGSACGGKVAGAEIRIVNALPQRRQELVRFTLPGAQVVQVTSPDGQAVPTQCVPSMDTPGATDVLFLGQACALGTADYCVAPAGGAVADPTEADEVALQAGQSQYTIRRDGTVTRAMAGGSNLLSGAGHDLHYLAESGEIVGGPGRRGTLKVFQGPLGHVVRVQADVGDIRTEIEFLATPHLPYLQITTRFHFDKHAIGVMWQDWTKLNSYWPAAGSDIRHDIAYGSVAGRPTVPLYAPSWLSIGGPGGRLTVFNTGTPKHYVADGVLACVWAWGGRSFSNRMHADWAKKDQYDLRLSGVHLIRSAVQAVADASDAQLARAAQSLNSPLIALGGPLGPQPAPIRQPLDLLETSLISTAVVRRGGVPALRFFESDGKTHSATQLSEALGQSVKITDLRGRPMDSISPYRIGYITHA